MAIEPILPDRVLFPAVQNEWREALLEVIESHLLDYLSMVRKCLRHKRTRCKQCRELARRKNQRNGRAGAKSRWAGHVSEANVLAKKLGISRQAAYWRLKNPK